MSIHIISGVDTNNCDEPIAALFDFTAGQTFGPTFDDQWEAQEFLDWCQAEYGGVKPETVMDSYGQWIHDRRAGERLEEFCCDQ